MSGKRKYKSGYQKRLEKNEREARRVAVSQPIKTFFKTGGVSLTTTKNCAPANGCPSGSINLGIGKVSSYCCSTDLCNSQDPPDLSTSAANGKTCYYCDLSKNCSNTLRCSGSEDRCIKATGTFGGQSAAVKGCASKLVCDAPTLVPNVEGISCCEGNLCNGAQSVTQSFLFLCCSLLSYFLLH